VYVQSPPNVLATVLTHQSGIKKRNHKLLDYDAVRAKVKKLTEKPDKDPSKLPRTEKEAEMVSLNNFLREASFSPGLAASAAPSHSHNDLIISEPDLSVPSPTKALDKVARIRQLQREDEELVRMHSGVIGLGGSSSLLSHKPIRVSSESESVLMRSASGMSHASTVRAASIGSSTKVPGGRAFSTDVQPPSHHSGHQCGLRTTATGYISGSGPSVRHQTSGLAVSRLAAVQPRLKSAGGIHMAKTEIKTPFFHPSELEILMEPLKEEYIKNKADDLMQAKAAYEQLNDQLTNELPQLIDLRYVLYMLSHATLLWLAVETH
jgi:hypothetical protein